MPDLSGLTTALDGLEGAVHSLLASLSGTLIPESIDRTGTTDVSAALNAWIEGVPDGTTIVFRPGAYLMSHGIMIADRTGLVFEGNGATLRTNGSGADQLSSLFVLGYQGWWRGGINNVAIRNLTLEGNSPTPGHYISGAEAQSGIYVVSSVNVEIANVLIRGVHGDGIATDGNSTDGVHVHDCHVETCGRNGVAILAGRNVTVERCAFDHVGYYGLDCEPWEASGVIDGVTFRNNTQDTWQDIGWGAGFFAADGEAGSTIRNVTVDGNTITGGTLRSDVTLARRQNIAFTNNRSLVAGAGPILHFAHVDGLTVTGNVQPLTSGQLASIVDCTGVVT